MKFVKGETPCQPHCWFSGIYKIVVYSDHINGYGTGAPIYYAYFTPRGWKNWGNSVNFSADRVKNSSLTSLKAAKEACEKHANMFPDPTQSDKVSI